MFHFSCFLDFDSSIAVPSNVPIQFRLCSGYVPPHLSCYVISLYCQRFVYVLFTFQLCSVIWVPIIRFHIWFCLCFSNVQIQNQIQQSSFRQGYLGAQVDRPQSLFYLYLKNFTAKLDWLSPGGPGCLWVPQEGLSRNTVLAHRWAKAHGTKGTHLGTLYGSVLDCMQPGTVVLGPPGDMN